MAESVDGSGSLDTFQGPLSRFPHLIYKLVYRRILFRQYRACRASGCGDILFHRLTLLVVYDLDR